MRKQSALTALAPHVSQVPMYVEVDATENYVSANFVLHSC